MIRVERKKEPADFDQKVRKPGCAYMFKNPGKKPPHFWKHCKKDLYQAYGGYCAYTTFRINNRNDAVVDHFLPKSRHPDLCYEWSNYRLSSFHINSVKKDSERVIDPFELPEDAFRLAENMCIEVNPEAFSDEKSLRLAYDTLRQLKLNCPELIADRTEMLNEALEKIKEDPGATSIVSWALFKQSRFIHQEAVRKGYVAPL